MSAAERGAKGAAARASVSPLLDFRKKLKRLQGNAKKLARLVKSAAPVLGEETGAWFKGGQVDQAVAIASRSASLVRELEAAYMAAFDGEHRTRKRHGGRS